MIAYTETGQAKRESVIGRVTEIWIRDYILKTFTLSLNTLHIHTWNTYYIFLIFVMIVLYITVSSMFVIDFRIVALYELSYEKMSDYDPQEECVTLTRMKTILLLRSF